MILWDTRGHPFIKTLEMNKIKIFSIALSLFTIPTFVACSEDDDSKVQNLASKTTITLGNYYQKAADYKTVGKAVTPSWTSSDKGAIALEVDGKMNKAYASPILPGSSSSLFMFNIMASRQETHVISWYPSDADVSVSGTNILYNIPTSQTGDEVPVMFDYEMTKVNAYSGTQFKLTPGGCLLFVNIAMGDYDISSLRLVANGSEKIAGDVTYCFVDDTYEATVSSVTVSFAEPVSCRSNEVYIPVYCAPCTLSKGVTAEITTSTGQTLTSSVSDAIELVAGSTACTSKIAEGESTELVFCGDNHVFVINASIIKDSYKESIVWSWDATSAASTLGLAASKCDHLDECKFVDNGTKLLLTSSYGWCVLMDYPTGKILFYTTQTPNAHSAEYIPGGYIAVATSTGSTDNHNKVQLYSVDKSEQQLATAELYSGHGVVWDYKRNLLYAAGGNLIKVFDVTGLGTDNVALTLKKSITTPKSGLHDLNRVDDNTLSVAGDHAYLFNVETEQFTEMALFSASSALKSLNYNAGTGEVWYTDATVPEGDESWSSHKIRYSADKDATSPSRIINVDIDMYKVRVKNW